MKAVVYARYSTDNQNQDTIDVQVSACAKYAENHSIEIIDIFADEAVSGMKNKRPELDRFFIALPLKLFDCVLIYDQSRFSRDIVDWFTFRRAVQNNGVKLISATQSFVGGDLDDPSVFATEGINALVNQIHVLQTRQKVIEKMNYIARQGLHTGGNPALGYDVVDKHYVINDSEAEVVRIIFTMYSLDKSYSTIIDELNRKGYQTKLGKSFGKNSLSELLRNEKYVGVYLYNKIPPSISGKRNSHAINDKAIRIEGIIPPIISKELWNTVSKRLHDNKRNATNTAKHDYLLSGKAFCGKCKMAMTGTRSKGTYFYYDCSGKKRLRNCDKKPISQLALETMVVNYVKQALALKADREAIARKLFEAQNKMQLAVPPIRIMLQKQLKDVTLKISNINNAIADGVYNSSTTALLSKLENTQSELYMKLAETEKTKVCATTSYEDILIALTNISSDVGDDIETKRTLICFVDRVYVFDDYIEIIINPLDIEIKEGNLPLNKGTGSPAP